MHQVSLYFLLGLMSKFYLQVSAYIKREAEMNFTYLQLDYHKPTLIANILHLLLQVLKLKYITIEIVPFFRLGFAAYI